MSSDEREHPVWEDPRTVLARHGLRPKRGYSQNFLIGRGVLESIAEAVGPAPGDVVVELGPGLGTLTGALLRRGAMVVGVERDPDMLRVLREDLVPLGGLELLPGDAATVDLKQLASQHGGAITLVGNLPYAITGAILRNVTESSDHVRKVVVMVQREVRDRLLGESGTRDYGVLTVFTQAVFEVRSVRIVPPTAFFPRPDVTSAVVMLTPRKLPRAVITPTFQKVVKAAFGTRRKTLRNALQRMEAASPEHVATALSAAEIDGNRRGETLSIEEFARLATVWDR